MVRAAGGVVWRPSARGVEVLLVHRPRHDDWSLPKGKLDRGEPVAVAAVREVREETAVRAALQYPLSTVRYLSRGQPKTVEYWAMRVLAAEPFGPGSEVDRLRWVLLDAAAPLLSYDHDVEVVLALRPSTGVVVLLRHAAAGERGSWPGPDAARPLDQHGTAAARSLAPVLALFGPQRLVSAAPRRCVASLAPLSSLVDLPVEIDSAFDETSAPGAAAARVRALAGSAACTVVCSQRGVIPEVVGLLRGSGRPHTTAKGHGWILPFAGDALLDAYPLPVPGPG